MSHVDIGSTLYSLPYAGEQEPQQGHDGVRCVHLLQEVDEPTRSCVVQARSAAAVPSRQQPDVHPGRYGGSVLPTHGCHAGVLAVQHDQDVGGSLDVRVDAAER